MSSLQFVIIGAVQSTEAALLAAYETGASIKAVFTLAPEQGARRHSDYVNLAPHCERMGIPCHHISSKLDIDGNLLQDIAPDVLLVFGWSRLISDEIIALCRYGAIGLHPAPLPIGRGRHPLIWTILLGLKNSALCFFKLDAQADCGDIILRRNFSVDEDETAASLMAKVVSETQVAVPLLIHQIQSDGLQGIAQDDLNAISWRKRTARDGKIDFRMSAELVDRHVRALTRPYPGATAIHHQLGEQIVWAVKRTSRAPHQDHIEPGRVIGINSGDAIVACGNDAVILKTHEFTQPITIGSWFQ